MPSNARRISDSSEAQSMFAMRKRRDSIIGASDTTG